MHNRLRFFKRCTVWFFLIFLCQCREREERQVQRSFYYWKTVFRLSPTETKTLQQLSVQQLYVKFFDVEWNSQTKAPQPAAKSIFQQSPPAGMVITPVVFITQEPLQYATTEQLDALAANMSKLLSSMATNHSLQLTNEVQLDCDWTATTKNKYFYLLENLKKQPFFQHKTLSATIRLHQVKFLSQTGVPPVNKGLLMCYNLGNLRLPQTKNSILEEAELKKYIHHLDSYPLPLDIALPIFDWYVLFEGNTYKGLVRDFDPGEKRAKQKRIVFTRDTILNGYAFKAGQWLRHESSNPDVVRRCAERVSEKRNEKRLTVILYHLDEQNLDKYTRHELESFYNALR